MGTPRQKTWPSKAGVIFASRAFVCQITGRLANSNAILVAPLRRVRLSCAVPKLRAFLKYWLPPLLWLTVIFTGSSDSKSYEHSSRFVEPILRWLFPRMPQTEVEIIHHFIRKCGHVTEYAVLTLLLWRAVRKPVKNDPRPYGWPDARLTLLIVILCAAADEFHQRFVPTRSSLISDVFVDAAGGAGALLALWIFGHWCKRR
jgi:VanZ family protein